MSWLELSRYLGVHALSCSLDGKLWLTLQSPLRRVVMWTILGHSQRWNAICKSPRLSKGNKKFPSWLIFRVYHLRLVWGFMSTSVWLTAPAPGLDLSNRYTRKCHSLPCGIFVLVVLIFEKRRRLGPTLNVMGNFRAKRAEIIMMPDTWFENHSLSRQHRVGQWVQTWLFRIYRGTL